MASSSTDLVDRDFKPSSSSGDSPHDVTRSGDSPNDAMCRRRSSSSPEQYARDVTSYWDSGQLDRDSSQWETMPDVDSLDGTTYLSEGAEGGGDQSKVVHSTCPDLCLEKRQKLKAQKDKTCLVCGDKALGYNFNAISCESCKAFFRRNAFKEIRGRCDGSCDVTVESRSYCKKCRLRKCFEVGMKRDLILNDTQKQVRRIKIQENRFRRHGMPVPPELHNQAATLAAVPHASAAGPAAGSSEASTAGAKPRRLPSPEPSLVEKLKEDPDAVTHTFTKQIELDQLGLSDESRTKIQEILDAFQLSFDGPMERNPLATPTGTDFLNMADTSVRRLVKMAKQLSKFCSFSQEDQISLLKGAVVEVLVLRSAKMFDTSTRGWFVNKGGKQHMVSAMSMLNNQDSQSFFQQYQRFATSLLQSTHHDSIVLMLMIVMTVMSPDRSSIKSTNEIAKTQEEYASLLKQYLHVRYPDDELMFARVLQKLADVRELNETHTRMLMHMNVEDLEPLIVEIFDMSS